MSLSEIGPGVRVELRADAGYHVAGVQGVVLEIAKSRAVIRFDRPDGFGVRTAVTELSALRAVDQRVD